MQQSRAITRKSASNLALAFVLLPRDRRDAMSALYAFCRQVDDAGDDLSVPIEERRRLLAAWRQDVRLACEGGQPHLPVNIELQPVIRQYRLPFTLFDELIRGVEMDLDIKRYETMAALEQYCYRVASVVGLLSIEIFGYRNPACKEYAICLGKALQLTNILRDVGHDAALGRIYLPLEDLRKFHVREEDILRGVYSEDYCSLANKIAQHARHFYQRARELLPPEDRRAMAAAELMGSVYWRLLLKLERERFNVFAARPTRLSKGCKMMLVARHWWRVLSGETSPCYGTP